MHKNSAKSPQIPTQLVNSARSYGKRLQFGLFAIMCATAYSGSCVAQSEPGSIARKYSEYCSVCHGDKGDGASHAQQGLFPPPKDFTDPVFAQSMTRDRLISVITDGKPGTAMIAWKTELTEAEIVEMTDFIMATFMTPAARHPAAASAGSPDGEASRVYQEACSVCHGDDGKGAVWGQQSLSVAPRDFTTAEASQELTRERMIAAVTYGRPGTPMPGFATQMSPEQVEVIVDYVRGRFMNDPHGAAAVAEEIGNTIASGEYHQMPFDDGVSGLYEKGRVIYMGNCVECHGMGGDGNGPRAYFIFPRPRSFLDPATQQILNRPRLFTGIRDGVLGREMPAWSKVMDDQAIADVAEYVYREFVQPGLQ